MITRRCAAALLLAVLGSANVRAQQAVAPVLVQPAASVALHGPHLATLRRLAAVGDSLRIAGAARELLDDLDITKFSRVCCNYRRDFFLLVFTAPDSGGTPQVVPVLLHDPMPDSSELPGIDGSGGARLYEIFVSEPDDGSEVQATYTITHEESPAEKQLADFAGTVIGKLAFPVSTIPRPTRPAAPEHAIMVRFSQVVLPEPGRITSKYLVRYADLALHLRTIAAAVDLEQSAQLRSGATASATTPACLDLTARMRSTFESTLAAAPCGPWIGDAAACSKKLTAELGRAANDYFAASPQCPAAVGSGVVQAFVDGAADVRSISATSTISNSALVRYGFGLAFGYIAHIDLDTLHPRAQLQSGRLTANPFSRTLAMAIVNLTPWGYDAQRRRPSLAERARLFAGPVLTPNYGVTAGFAYAINRYLAVNVGYARLWFDAVKGGETLDQPPSEGNRADPFDLRSTGAMFVGLSYNLR